MMKIIELESWEAFCSAADEVQCKYENIPLLFRGQPNSNWCLRTTLERYSKSSWTIRKYCSLVVDCVRGLGPLDDYTGDIPSLSDIDRELAQNMTDVLVHIPASISFYWTYLRHHGFPSPLLDWTRSPYIAAFFAFCESVRAKNVAVFAFVDSINGEKHVWKGKPQITAKWLAVHPHVRHSRQQSSYTIATKAVKNDHQFAPHAHVFREDEIDQDLLAKYVIPSAESIKAMKWLDGMGINYYSLMDDREALLKTYALREITFQGL
ncbi:MAG: hypothetical protein CVU57_17920 [Deltaproteobacteria bacterium HGW-Deltaproteobacteria-15]|jgi:hypothetical protein|nr:MAG: hypothetical protein CVU57_17920 [Deltaproteobacteria bacterium HGW-Deltaproteobacteria-15]